MMDARKMREKAFHDQEYADEVRWQAVDKYYSIIEGRARFWEDFLRARCAGKRVLEYGCGQGKYTPRLAEFGGNVTGIDLSETAMANARASARADLPADWTCVEINATGGSGDLSTDG